MGLVGDAVGQDLVDDLEPGVPAEADPEGDDRVDLHQRAVAGDPFDAATAPVVQRQPGQGRARQPSATRLAEEGAHPVRVGGLLEAERELVRVAVAVAGPVPPDPARGADERHHQVEDHRHHGDRPQGQDRGPPLRVRIADIENVTGLDGEQHRRGGEHEHQEVVDVPARPLRHRATGAAALDLGDRFLLASDLLLLVQQVLAPGVLDRVLQPPDVVSQPAQQGLPVVQLDGQAPDVAGQR